MPQSEAPLRPSVFQLDLSDPSDLHAAYMPLLADGGVFITTTREFGLGDSIYLLLALPQTPRRVPLVCTVCWVTPRNAPGQHPQGIGVRFPATADAAELRLRIEERLGPLLLSDRATLTI